MVTNTFNIIDHQEPNWNYDPCPYRKEEIQSERRRRHSSEFMQRTVLICPISECTVPS